MEQRASQYLAWSDSLLTGDPKIDADHREIFNLLSNLWSDDPLSRTESMKVLVAHLTDHFAGEESLPSFQALPALEAEQHRNEHKVLGQFVLQAKSGVCQDEDEFMGALMNFIQEKLIPHIRNRDKRLAGR